MLGLTPEQAEEWQKTTEREFNLWAKDKRACDATGMNNFYGSSSSPLCRGSYPATVSD